MMTIRQQLLKLFYPLLVRLSQGKKSKVIYNEQVVKPPVSFYSLPILLNNGKIFSLENLRGKKILIVNTASDCGYTAQYAELQKLYQYAKEDLEIIAFPANDFKEQEKGSDEDIAAFCSVNFGVSFPIAKKTKVTSGTGQDAVFQWLSKKELNGWNEQPPSWNFAKYLVNEQGVLTHYFDAAVSPVGEEIVSAIKQ